jgi:hypothetical protein
MNIMAEKRGFIKKHGAKLLVGGALVGAVLYGQARGEESGGDVAPPGDGTPPVAGASTGPAGKPRATEAAEPRADLGCKGITITRAGAYVLVNAVVTGTVPPDSVFRVEAEYKGDDVDQGATYPTDIRLPREGLEAVSGTLVVPGREFVCGSEQKVSQ